MILTTPESKLLFFLLLPLFLIAFLGYALSKFHWLKNDWSNGVGALTGKVLVPALLFHGAYKTGLVPATGLDESWRTLVSFYGSLLFFFFLTLYAFKRTGNQASRALATTYSNTVFLGIPMLIQVLGNGSLQFAFPIIAFHSLITFSLYYLYAPNDDVLQGQGNQLFASLKNSLSNPIVVSLFLGMLWNSLSLPLPQWLLPFLTMLGNAALPCALLSLGASMCNFSLQSWRSAFLITVMKLLLFPALVWVLAHLVFHVSQQATAVLVLLAGCPVGINAFIVAQAHGDDTRVLSSAILLSSLGCMLSLPMWIAILV